jgi:hypothetical protein
MVRPRRNPIFAADIRELGGVVSVHTDRCHSDGAAVFRVGHISGGGDVAFLSLPIVLEDHAAAAARVLAEFVGGTTESNLPDRQNSFEREEVRLAP